jgi:hypothetical protein
MNAVSGRKTKAWLLERRTNGIDFELSQSMSIPTPKGRKAGMAKQQPSRHFDKKNGLLRWPAFLLGSGMILSGCVGPTVIVMKNPKTGELVQCRGANTGLSMPAESIAARDCAQGYLAAGWLRMN